MDSTIGTSATEIFPRKRSSVRSLFSLITSNQWIKYYAILLAVFIPLSCYPMCHKGHNALAEPNPPVWGSNVYIFTPGMSHAQDTIDKIYNTVGGDCNNGQFSSARYALLFMPGTHNLDVRVGYYTSVMGLGRDPANTDIGQVSCPEGCTSNYQNGALCTFWRSAENFTITPGFLPWSKDKGMMWAVSQASPLRRIIVNGDLHLYEYVAPDCCSGWSSGGYMSNCDIMGSIYSSSQQQWMTRNCSFHNFPQGNWNMVFVGCASDTTLPSHCGSKGGLPFTVVKATPVIAEKPYIVFENERYYIAVPALETNKQGTSSSWNQDPLIDLSNVYVAKSTDDVSIINSKLASGLHLILTPGNYPLKDSINVTNPNTIILGIGFPTLISQNGNSCITVANVDGVRIAGVLLQAGTNDSTLPTKPLLQWGVAGYKGTSANPGFLYDCFARVGGPTNSVTNPVRADIMVQINSGNVICDDLWLWRADHDIQGLVKDSHNTCHTGFQINGDNVIAYGLAVEHTLQNLTEWFGNFGQTYFYQSELPYDVTQANYGTPGYVSYRVGDLVTNHSAWGVGVYSYFRDYHVTVESGIKTPSGNGIKFINPMSVFLNGFGEISHVIQQGSAFSGDAVNSTNAKAYVCPNRRSHH